jgi:hypothetical protein
MTKYWYSLLVASSLAVGQPVGAATELCPGPALINGTIQNGSTCNLQSTGTTVNEIFVGVSARDDDQLNLGTTLIFDNVANTPGDTASQTVPPTSALNFNIVNTNDILNLVFGPAVYNTGTAYTNAPPPFSDSLSPIYHFAWLDVANASDFNSVFGPRVTIAAGVDSYILSHGGYPDWIFAGAEDSRVTESDDWNDVVYAFQNVEPVGSTPPGGPTRPGVPEPSTWALLVLGFAGLRFAGYRSAWKRLPVAA